MHFCKKNIHLKCYKYFFLTSADQGRTYPLGKGRRLPWAPKSQGPPKMLFIYKMRIKRGHANGFCLQCLLPRQPSACPSWTCFLCILLVANENIMHLKLTARSMSLFLSLCSASGWKELRFQLKHRYVASLILHASIAEITAQLLSLSMCSLFDFIRRRHDYKSGFLCRLKMGRVSVTILYSFLCLTTETVKYINENCFIENLAASKYSVWQTNVIINNKCTFCMFRRRAALSCENVNRFVSVNCSMQRKRSNRNLVCLCSFSWV